MTWILPRQLHTLASALDTEALSLDCTEQSEICARSLFVRSKPSPLRTWSAKWKRDSWTQHLSGRILRPSLGQRFVTEWTSSLEATHASHSQPLESGPAKKIRGISGPGSQMVFDFSDPAAASLKTSKDISAWGCPTSSKTWQEWVTERRGAYSARLKSAHRTSASGSSSWPTVTANEDSYRIGGDSQQSHCLSAMARRGEMSWPTPAAQDHKDSGENVDMEKVAAKSKLAGVVAMHGPPVPASSSTDGSRPGLSVATRDGNWTTPAATDTGRTTQYQQGGKALSMQAAAVQWQTATVSTGAHRQKDGSMIDKLDQQVKSWATPRVHEHMEPPDQWKARNIKKKAENPKLGTLDKPLGTMVAEHQITSGKLNPRWVETLMGLPVGWTMPSCVSPVTIGLMSCGCSATESCQPLPSGPSGS